ncbi:hypothetical protein A4X09_0g2548 [Tilletia walkeri]|uniref:DIS3-like exonuclease 2 n=1 Tax=Tilletia walkeri TaxID=117179 RepID=A0A8X7ND36_9BASI|nr:hypothetical protein A4X09_0g2548 [Tilletia walkeri]
MADNNTNNSGNKTGANGGGGGGRGGHRHSQSRGGGNSQHGRRDSAQSATGGPPSRKTSQRSSSSTTGGDTANLQHLLQDMKGTGAAAAAAASPSTAPTASSNNPAEIKAQLAAIGDRLALQEEELQNQLQHQLNISAAVTAGAGTAGARPARVSTLPSLDENAPTSGNSPGASDSASPGGANPAAHRQGGPRFAGNAAFQSAVARHAANNTGPNNGGMHLANDANSRSALNHQRQLSLQGRFADLGYNVANANFHQGILNASNEYDSYDDDRATTVSSDFAGNSSFDPTRRPSPSQSGNFPHRRAGSDLSGLSPAQRLSSPASVGGPYGTNNNSPASAQAQAAAAVAVAQARHQQQHQQQLIAGQIAIQQQIELLQMQQQQLLQQQIQFNPSAALGGNRPGAGGGGAAGSPGSGPAGHRRIQSHAPGAGGANNFVPSMNLYGSNNALAGGFQGMTPSASMGGLQQQQQQGQHVPRGHGRRHSVNVVNKSAQQQQQQQQQQQASISPISPSNDSSTSASNAFGFPSPSGGASGPGSSPAEVIQAVIPAVGRHTVGHFSHPSVQLASLSPEYLLAAGGLVSLGGLGSAGMNEFALADGFTTMGGAQGGGGGQGGGRGAHNRTGSSSWRINSNAGSTGHVVDLAQAQAQLATLHQFRAQSGGGQQGGGGGGGHNKNSASFGGGFNPMMGGNFGGGNQFGGQFGGGGNSASQRKALFGSYLPQAALPPLLAAGKLVVGMLRINKRNRSDAYVSTEVLDSDIFISGSKDRNRALEGDLVAVELLDPNEVWSIKKEKEDKKKRKEESGAVVARKPDKAKDDLEVEGAQLRLIEDEEENDQTPPALAGHVVAIVERTPGQLFSGTLGLLRPSSAATKEKQQAERALREGGDGTQGQEPQVRPKIVWFRPSDKRVPLIAIPAEQAPSDFWDEGGQESYNNRLFVASIKRWPITSLHPFGTLVEEIGVIGNVEAETQALLKDSLASVTEDFGENVLKCIPPLPWTIPEREYEVRRDFRDARVFTIDPETAKDLDDAVSVRDLDGGLIEVGVHIADVSYFVKSGNALDRDAKKRGTSVYLVQRAVPMLPPALSEELCSLVPGVERLAFSAVFTMTKEGHVIGTWHGRTVIRSCAKLAYADAQEAIEGRSVPEAKVQKFSAGEGDDDEDAIANAAPIGASEIASDIRQLHDLAQKLRKRRFDNGALKIDNVKLSFKLDEHGLPTDASPYKTFEAHQLIEEFMLQANMSVATRIASGLPEISLLRRHERPIERRLQGFKERAKSLGYEIDITTGGTLFASLRAIEDPKDREALENLATKSMLRAKYFCTGMVDIAKYEHFALNVPLYTHFTSPIRRYADLLVHRQLDAILQNATEKFSLDRETVAKIAQQCNVKRDAAKLAQEQSAHLFLCLLIHDLTMRYGPVIRNATVIGVLDAAFDVVISEFGVEKRVHVDQMPIEHHIHDEHSNQLSIYWKEGVDVLQWLAENSDDVHVKRVREAQAHIKNMEMTSLSHDDEQALFDDDEDEAIMAARRAMLSGEDARDSVQRTKSFKKEPPVFQGIKDNSDGHRIQTIKELGTVPVIITSDMTKSPPVLKVFAVNPWGPGVSDHSA